MTFNDDIFNDDEDDFESFSPSSEESLFKEEFSPQKIVDENAPVDDRKEFGAIIPIGDGGYQQEKIVEIEGQNPIKVKLNIPKKPKLEHEIKMWDKLNRFEQDVWSPTNKGFKSGFDSIDKAFDGGIKPGFIVIAGDSNLGKSAVMSQLAYNIASLNDDVYVMDYSLDDPFKDKIPRIIGGNAKIILNAVKNPNDYKHLPLMLVRRAEALNQLRARTDKYIAYDNNDTSFIEDIEEEVEKMMITFDKEGINKKVVLFIDNMHDLNIKTQPNLQDKQKYDYIASWAADLAIKYDIPVICTAELKKLNSTRRPTLDDVRESVKIKYEAKAIIMVYNEVHYKGESADVYFYRSTSTMKQPVLELHFAKNKISSYKGRCFFEFFPDMARLEEADDKSSKLYAGAIYGS